MTDMLSLFVRTTYKPSLFMKTKSKKEAASIRTSSEKNSTGISSLTNSSILPPFWSQFNLRWCITQNFNWPVGNELLYLVLDITKISTFSYIWSLTWSNSFLRELMLRFAKAMRFKFLICTFLILLKITFEEVFTDHSADKNNFSILRYFLNLIHFFVFLTKQICFIR